VGGVSGDVLLALAQFAGQTVAAAAVTDVWESARSRFAKLLGRGDAQRAKAAERWLTQTHEQLTAVGPGTALEQAREAAAERWTGRFADLLDEDPSLATELRALADEVAAELPDGTVSATDHSLAAGRDLRIEASHGGFAAGVFHGNMTLPSAAQPFPAPPSAAPPDPTRPASAPPDPTLPGPAQP
jgi:hypothetical protein